MKIDNGYEVDDNGNIIGMSSINYRKSKEEWYKDIIKGLVRKFTKG